MSQLTRCPNCATTFRVSDTQLQSRGGRVRCGHCSFVFNAKACLVDADPITIIDIGHESGADDGEDFPKTEPGRPIRPRREEAKPARPPAPEAVTGAAATDPAAAAAAPAAAAAVDTAAVDTAPAEAAGSVAAGHEWLDELEELPPPSWLRQPSAAESEDAPAPPPAPDETGSERERAATARAEDEDYIPTQIRPVRAEGNRRPGTKHKKARRRKAAPVAREPAVDDSWLKPTGPSPWRWAWRAAYLALALSAAGLAAVFFRQPLVESYPAARGWLARACAPLGCEVRAPRNAELLVLDGIEFSFDPERPGLLELNGVLRNNATYAQAWPLLDVQLLDAQGQRVARRFIRPAAYLPTAERSQPDFPPQTEVQLSVGMRLNGLNVENYRVAIFYP